MVVFVNYECCVQCCLIGCKEGCGLVVGAFMCIGSGFWVIVNARTRCGGMEYWALVR